MSDFENNVNSPTLQNNAISIRCKYAEVLMELRDCGISHYFVLLHKSMMNVRECRPQGNSVTLLIVD